MDGLLLAVGLLVFLLCAGAGALWWRRRARKRRVRGDELGRSPLTGQGQEPAQVVATFGDTDPYRELVDRVLGDLVEIPQVRLEAHEIDPQHRPVVAGRKLGFDDEVKLLREAWESGDVDGLLLHADSEFPSAGAARVLLAVSSGRGGGNLERLVAAGQGGETFAYLKELGADVTYSYAAPAWGLKGEVKDAREGVALMGACELLSRNHEGDALEAHWALAAAPTTERIAMMRLVTLVELGWWDELAEADVSVLGQFAPVGLYSQGVGAAMNGYEGEAVELFSAALDGVPVEGLTEFPQFRLNVLYARAIALQSLGDGVGAWNDLVAISQEDGDYPGVKDLLKRV